jgi:hypothetical protein
MLSSLRRQGDMVWTPGSVSAPLFSALATDERCFHMTDPHETWEKLQCQLLTEQTYTKAVGPQMSPHKVAETYRV